MVSLQDVMQLAMEYEGTIKEKESLIDEIKNSKMETSYDKKQFMEGAKWILNKNHEEIKDLQAAV